MYLEDYLYCIECCLQDFAPKRQKELTTLHYENGILATTGSNPVQGITSHILSRPYTVQIAASSLEAGWHLESVKLALHMPIICSFFPFQDVYQQFCQCKGTIRTAILDIPTTFLIVWAWFFYGLLGPRMLVRWCKGSSSSDVSFIQRRLCSMWK